TSWSISVRRGSWRRNAMSAGVATQRDPADSTNRAPRGLSGRPALHQHVLQRASALALRDIAGPSDRLHDGRALLGGELVLREDGSGVAHEVVEEFALDHRAPHQISN